MVQDGKEIPALQTAAEGIAHGEAGLTQARLQPNGQCWCGCGGLTAPDKFWLGHDSTARKAVLERKFGDTVDMLYVLGYGPGRRNAITDEDEHRAPWNGDRTGNGDAN